MKNPKEYTIRLQEGVDIRIVLHMLEDGGEGLVPIERPGNIIDIYDVGYNPDNVE